MIGQVSACSSGISSKIEEQEVNSTSQVSIHAIKEIEVVINTH